MTHSRHRHSPERFNKSSIVTWYSGTVHVAPIFTTRFQTDLLYSLHIDLVRLCSDSARSRSGSVRSCSSLVRSCSVLSGRVLALSGCVLVLSGPSGRCEMHRNTLRKVENLPKFHHEQRGYSALHDFPINRVERGRSELETNWSEEWFWSAYIRTHRQFFRTQ